MKRLLLALLILAASASAQTTTLAATPPMGWNSWNKFGCKVSETLIKQAADNMVTSGMKDAGYEYIVIDDCWQIDRDKDGNIIPDPKNFPSGIKALADYVHSKGLKFGIYSDAGTKTCAKRPGSRGYEFQDARQYAAWGVDYLKYDWCSTSTQNAEASYTIMRDALRASGRPIVFSICEWGTAKPWLWAKDVGNLWRTTGDIKDRFDGAEKWYDGVCCNYGVMAIVDLQVGLESFAGPGHWNDPDMLEVGNGGLNDTENRSHFSMWAMLAAPLMAGNDLQAMTPAVRDILTNREVIAIDQDVLGKQGHRARKDGDLEVWVREIAGGNRAVVLLNRGKDTQTIAVNWEELGYPNHLSATLRDLWEKKDLGKFSGKFSAQVPSHGVVMITVKP